MVRKLFALVFVVSLVAGIGLAMKPVDRAPGDGMAVFPNVESVSYEGVTRIPSWVHGDLGTLPRGEVATAAVVYMEKVAPVFDLEPGDVLRPVGVQSDDLGMRHIRLLQYHAGLPVDGGDIYVHVDSTGAVQTLNGHLGAGITRPPVPEIEGAEAVAFFVQRLQAQGLDVLTSPSLVYYTRAGEPAFLAWRFKAEWADRAGIYRERIYVDADDGTVLDRQSLIWSALNRRVYTANYGTSLPGSLMFSEGGSSSDATAMAAYNNAGNTYNYYKTKYNRDSYDNSGAMLISTVHYSSSYNNAFWDGSQMVYGDGDGSTFSPFAGAFDVVAHELTHAVTERTANLNYSYESGALNEAMSDIMAASAEAWVDGGVNSNTWKIGEDCYTPSTSGDALRYMNNPTADGQSYDYYPERYTGSQDNGGVHLNSGIANLAYYLLSQGGTHPRNKTTVNVPAVGINKAEQIFYRALANYMTSTTDFEGARNATAQAATDLYGTTETNAVQATWDAVGVPGGGGSGGGTVTDLSNGVAVTNLSGSTGSWAYYKIAVPSGQDSLVIAISGGSGDCDLYVKRGSQPSSSSYDYRPYLNGNNETVTVTSPAAGDWYVGLNAYSSYSGLTLTATYTGGSEPPPDPGDGVIVLDNGVAVTNLSGAKGADAFYKIAVPASQTSLEIKIWGGSGDCDLYVKRGSQPTTSSYDYRPYLSGNNETVTVTNPTSGDWYIMLHGYAAYSGMSLQATYVGNSEPPPDPGDGVTELSNGVPVTNLSGAQGSDTFYKIVVPASQSTLEIKTYSGSGDCDLYVRFGAQPTTSTYDYRPYLSGNNETVTVSNPQAGTWYIMLHGYASFSGMSLQGAYSGGGGGSTSMNESESNNTTSSADVIASSPMNVTGYIGSSSDVDYFKVSLAAGHTLTLDMAVPSGKDYDVKFYNASGSTLATGQNGTGQSEHVTYTASSSMTVYVKVYPYSGSSTTTPYTLDVTF